MLLRPYLNDAGSCASYIFGCTSHNTLAVVDPHADFVDDYVAAADAIGAPIVAVFETDVQADHVSGLPALLERTGATGYLPGAGVVWVGTAVIVTEGLLLSIFAARDTRAHVVLEQQAHAERTAQHAGLRSAFVYATVRDPVLRACSQAGLVNNLNDALAWGLAPLYLAAHGATVREIAIVAAASSPRAAIAVVAARAAASGFVIAGTPGSRALLFDRLPSRDKEVW
jgi:hypothetical protein